MRLDPIDGFSLEQFRAYEGQHEDCCDCPEITPDEFAAMQEWTDEEMFGDNPK